MFGEAGNEIINPKFKYRNQKQYQNNNAQNSKQKRKLVLVVRFWLFEFL